MRVAKAKHPTGPFVKRNYPVLETDWSLYGSVRLPSLAGSVDVVPLQGQNSTWVGPGHGSVVEEGGAWWMFYHAWAWASVGHQSPGRQLLLDRVLWRRGWPVLGSPSVQRTTAPVVTGE